jgi:GntR family transcriptional regulator, carbon starvation induced regulator
LKDIEIFPSILGSLHDELRTQVRDTGASLNESAFRVLRTDIVHGRLAAGSRLRVERLRDRYGFGATPLREALSRLVETGLVDAIAQRGFRVAPVSQADLDDVTEHRIALEVLALRDSMQHKDPSWDATIVSSHYLLARAEEALADRTNAAFDEYERCNRNFHEALVGACASRWTLRFRAQIYDQHERYRRISMLVAPRRSIDVREEHRLIQEAAVRGDVDAACDVSTLHILRTVSDIRTTLPQKSR